MSDASNIASVISTGGGGIVFEQHVGAMFLSLLLTGTFLPIFPQATAVRVHFQAKRHGWASDDLVVECLDADSKQRRLATQIKRTFTVSENNDECRKTLIAAWTDFHNADLFDATRDAIALIVHLGTNRLLSDFAWLLTQARVSISADDFIARLSGPGLLNNQAKKDYETVKNIIVAATERPIADHEMWPVLQIFHVLSYDLSGHSAKDESWVRTLLALFALDGQSEGSARATWNEFVVLAGKAAAAGQSFAREDLPAEVLAHHRQINPAEHADLIALRQHSQVVLDRVSSSGAQGISFARDDLMHEITEAAAAGQVVLIVGSAGSGKSVLAKRYVQANAAQHIVFAFAAEEFRVAHIDKVLSDAQISLNWTSLQALLSFQSSKMFLLDGLERLLESEDRGGLTDLLKSIHGDPSLQLILTCRDYHAEIVERSLLRPSGIDVRRVVVSELSDEELHAAILSVPALAIPLESPRLRRLLRNPFMLAQAAALPWPQDQPLPRTEKAFRERLWHEVVRHDAHLSDGLPSRRARALTCIALDRARSLKPFVEQPQGDVLAIQALASDNLITFDSAQRQRMAPAHDVYEDWALIEWLSSEYLAVEQDARSFAQARESHPALRRAYRKWMHELIETNPSAAAGYLTTIASDSGLAEYLRDDTLVAVLYSSSAGEFLTLFPAPLLENDARYLRRIVQLVRVACKTVSPLATKDSELSQQLHVPSGEAWPTLLSFLVNQWTSLPETMYPLTLALLEDWANGVSWRTPYPDGAESAGILLENFFPGANGGWHGASEKQRVIALVIRIPKVTPRLFADLTNRAKQVRRRGEDRDADLFAETLFKPLGSFAVCRDHPEPLIELCRSTWRVSPPAGDATQHQEWQTDIESSFGLEEHAPDRFFPESAFQGPFYHLLFFHPGRGVRFIVEWVNAAVAYFGEQRARREHVAPPACVALRFPDGHEREVWCDSRLWLAFRGTSVMPHLLESALMALEKWALEAIVHEPHEQFVIEAMKWILRHSNNVSLIAVVVSICLAHPKKTGELALQVMGCRAFFALDRGRMVLDAQATAPGGAGYEKQVLRDERLVSNKLPHRKHDLEWLTLVLQWTPLAVQVQGILDQHLGALPPKSEQDDQDRLWRLALSRMDRRMYNEVGVKDSGLTEISLSPPETDVQAVIDRDAPELNQYNRHIGLFAWATQQFEGNREHAQRREEWRERLVQSKAAQLEIATEPGERPFPTGGPATVAAICIRDHWEELSDDDRQWCETIVIEALSTSSSNPDSAMYSGSMNGVSACAYIVPLVRLRSGANSTIDAALINALLHADDEIRLEAIRGVSEFIVDQDPRLTALCISVLVEHATQRNIVEKQRAEWNDDGPEDFVAKMARVANHVRHTVSPASSESFPNLSHFGFETWADRRLARELMQLLRAHPDFPLAQDYFARIAQAIVAWLALDRGNNNRRRARDFELERLAEEAIATFLLNSSASVALKLAQPFVSAVATHPDGVASFVEKLLIAEDGQTEETRFWVLWDALASRILDASWVGHIDGDRVYGQSLVRKIFLNTRWNDGVRTWSRLGVDYAKIDELFKRLAKSTLVLESYTHYLYHIGAPSLPNAFALIVEKHGNELHAAISEDGNIRWYLDSLTARVLYENLKDIRTQPRLRNATMMILDSLVQAGSSIAFQLRDDFVTPSATGAEVHSN